jgi:signal transduction histidine kinase/GAF domain-containing protein
VRYNERHWHTNQWSDALGSPGEKDSAMAGRDTGEPARPAAWPIGGGEMGDRIHAHDWAATLLGPLERWPQSLRTAVDLMLASGFATSLAWGQEAIVLYNDAYSQIIGPRHPTALGQSSYAAFPESRALFTPVIAQVWRGESVTLEDQHYPLLRADGVEDVWFTITYLPLQDEAGAMAGVYAVLIETTQRVRAKAALRQGEERQAFLLQLSDALRSLDDPRCIKETACRMLVQQLRSERSFFAEIDEESSEVLVEPGYQQPGIPAVKGRFPITPFAPYASEYRAGRAVVIRDLATDPRVPDAVRERIAATRSTASISMPIMRAGKFRSLLSVNQLAARDWTADEVALVEEIAHRAWAEVERACAEEALRASESKLAIELADTQELHRISSRFIKEDEIDALYEHFLDAARSLMRSDMASMQMLKPDRQALYLLAHKGFTPQSATFWEWVDAGDASACGVVLKTGQPVIIPDIEAWDFVAGPDNLASYRLSGIRAVLSTPLMSRDGRLVGVMSTHWRDVHHPSDRELRLLDVLARQAADLIERRTAGEALRESEERFRTLVQASSEVIYRMSPDWSEMHELSGGGFLADSPSPSRAWLAHYIHPDDQRRVLAAIGEAVRTKSVFALEHRVLRADGSLGWMLSRAVPRLEADGAITEWFGAASDVTARKQAEAALREAHATLERRVAERTAELATTVEHLRASQARLRLLLEQMPAAVWTTDPGLRVSTLTGSLAHALPPILRQARRRSLPELASSDAAATRLRAAHQQALGGAVSDIDLAWDQRFFVCHVEALRDTDEHIVGTIGVAQDVTARTLLRLQEEFLRTISHELRTPVTALRAGLGMLELALSPVLGPEERDLLTSLRHTVEIQRLHIEDLLTARLVRAGALSLKRERLDLRLVVEEAAKTLRPLVDEKGQYLTLDLPVSLTVSGDARRLEQVVLNLLANAYRHTPSATQIRISAWVAAEEVRLAVRDTGPGIPPDQLEANFEPFQRAGQHSDGTGLGLSIVRELVRLHEGRLWVEATEGGGATFHLALRQAPDAATASASGP